MVNYSWVDCASQFAWKSPSLYQLFDIIKNSTPFPWKTLGFNNKLCGRPSYSPYSGQMDWKQQDLASLTTNLHSQLHTFSVSVNNFEYLPDKYYLIVIEFPTREPHNSTLISRIKKEYSLLKRSSSIGGKITSVPFGNSVLVHLPN